MRTTKGQEVADILAMFQAMEKAKSEAYFPGFDTQGREGSHLPWEGGHQRRAEALRPSMEGKMKPWPRKSHGRHLTEYRKMVSLWTKFGRPKELTADQAQTLLDILGCP